jgi:hypothetical protein
MCAKENVLHTQNYFLLLLQYCGLGWLREKETETSCDNTELFIKERQFYKHALQGASFQNESSFRQFRNNRYTHLFFRHHGSSSWSSGKTLTLI